MASPPTEDWRHGVAGLLVTPFDATDRLSPARLLPLLARGAAAGIAAWVVHDDIGECDALRAAEAAALQAALPALLAGRAPVVAGLGRNLPVAVTLARPRCWCRSQPDRTSRRVASSPMWRASPMRHRCRSSEVAWEIRTA
jgi:hypothetical protein